MLQVTVPSLRANNLLTLHHMHSSAYTCRLYNIAQMFPHCGFSRQPTAKATGL